MVDNIREKQKTTAHNAIKHARIVICIVIFVAIIMFIIEAYKTNLYEDSSASLISTAIMQLLLWGCLWLSYKRPFIGLLIPTILFLYATIITFNWEWKLEAEYFGGLTASILINFFTIRGTVYAYKYKNIKGPSLPI